MTPEYLKLKELRTADFSANNITALYNEGYVFTRLGKGVMQQTRSLRVDLSKFEPTSENRRILRKTDSLQLTAYSLPLTNYHWSIGKKAKDFYDTKFGKGIFTANKIKDLLTESKKSNFNLVLGYQPSAVSRQPSACIGYAICYTNENILHYAYPFYNLSPQTSNLIPNLGMGMMLRAVIYAKEQGKKYIHLGSATRPTDTYKLQFEGLEWWDGILWEENTQLLRQSLLLRV